MSEVTQTKGAGPAAPDPDVSALDRLVGTWAISGGATGEVTYEWLEGSHFLIQQVELEQFGQNIKGIEIIGRLRPFGGSPSDDVVSRFYDNMGNTLDYVYELEGDILTIWGGLRGSPAYYKGALSGGGDTLSGARVYPGGGGYESVARRSSPGK